MKLFISFIITILSSTTFAREPEFYRGNNLEKVDINEVIRSIPKGSVVFLGEQHGYGPIQKGQIAVLNTLRAQGHKVNVAMEFVDYTQQQALDSYREGTLNETDFLKQISWGSIKFDFYRDQILFPLAAQGEKTFAINSPRWLASEVAKKGIPSLNEDALKLFPPQFELGRESYKKRFTDMMAGHVPTPEAMQRYFETQSLWDDTMAWQVASLPLTLQDTIVVIVGQFHVEYGGGLPHRLQARLKTRPIVTIEELLYYDDENIPFEKLLPSPEYGPMGDYLLIVEEKS